MKILCQGIPEAAEYHLYFEGRLSAWQSPRRPGIKNIVSFPISAMTQLTAGQYMCIYRSGELWSNPSDPLDLVVTGNCPICGHPLSLNPGEGHHLLISFSVIQTLLCGFL